MFIRGFLDMILRKLDCHLELCDKDVKSVVFVHAGRARRGEQKRGNTLALDQAGFHVPFTKV
jgi:hypothetical protein